MTLYDQDDVVAIANPGFDLWKHGPQAQRFLTQGIIAGLAPPTNTDTPQTLRSHRSSTGCMIPKTRGTAMLDCGGLRATGATISLSLRIRRRWSVQNASDELRRTSEPKRGGSCMSRSRGRDYLVVPPPRSLPDESRPRDRWLDTIREGLNFTGSQTGSYTVDTDTVPFDVGVNDVALQATWADTATTCDDDVAVNPPRHTDLDPWVPRFINPSTMYPLTDDPDGQVLNHLLGNVPCTQKLTTFPTTSPAVRPVRSRRCRLLLYTRC